MNWVKSGKLRDLKPEPQGIPTFKKQGAKKELAKGTEEND